MTKYLPTVRVEGEIVTQPARTTVTRVFYGRVAIKLVPFILGVLFLLHSGAGLVSGLVTIVVLFFLASIFVPQISHLGSPGGSLFRVVGSLVSAASDILDGVVGPNKGQVPVVILNVQTTSRAAPPSEPDQPTLLRCPNPPCGYDNPGASRHCLSCGTALNEMQTNAEVRGPQRFSVRIEGQIVGGEPTVGHRVSIDAFDNRGNLLFIAGRDETTGADIIVKRNADTGQQH